ncbi:MAG: aminoacyl-tRNA hydrolase, partial [Magnetococcales bacterium]|nr:aminoacyl-tRNA hydrolase [Magnetococcales bacterium]
MADFSPPSALGRAVESSDAVRLLVGLGNPGEKYRDTRHNLGWEALLRIVDAYQLRATGRRFDGRFGDGPIATTRVWWLLPETYMNLAGQSVGAAVRFFKWTPGQVVVFHDDLDLEPGRVRIKCGGGHGGHNGLKSIQQSLGSADFVRVRLGIGRPPSGMDPAHFVLAPFNAAERTRIVPTLDRLPAALLRILAGDLAGAMNSLYNPPVTPGGVNPPGSLLK